MEVFGLKPTHSSKDEVSALVDSTSPGCISKYIFSEVKFKAFSMADMEPNFPMVEG